jgi:hypothetical protein
VVTQSYLQIIKHHNSLCVHFTCTHYHCSPYPMVSWPQKKITFATYITVGLKCPTRWEEKNKAYLHTRLLWALRQHTQNVFVWDLLQRDVQEVLSYLSYFPLQISSSCAKIQVKHHSFIKISCSVSNSLWWVSTLISCMGRKRFSSFFPSLPHIYPVILNFLPNKLYYYFYCKKNNCVQKILGK